MTDKIYDFEGTKLIKVPEPKDTFCDFYFLRIRHCNDFVKNVSDCVNEEGNFIFVKANEPVNKID